MKAYILQPPYSRDLSFSDEYFEYKMNLLDQCDESADIIVLPEYSDVPCAAETLEDNLYYHDRYINRLMSKCIETAKRCHSIVFVNALSKEEKGYRNTTYCYDRNGELVGKYFKKHLLPAEIDVLKLDREYTFEYSQLYVLELEGLRFAFLTCYDFYFYESFPKIALQDVDIIIGCSLQRSDTLDALEIMCRFLAYNTNAYVVRSSVSFAEDSDVCGASMIVTPKGEILANMRAKFGMTSAEFDPHAKYLKPAGYGNPYAPHYRYIEYGRKPWQYRNGGSAMVPDDEWMSYPRLCAAGGLQTIATAGSMEAIGAAVALDAQEVSIVLEDVEHFEKVLRKFSGHTVFHVELKGFDSEKMEKAVSLLKQYECEKYVYFVSDNAELLERVKAVMVNARLCLVGDIEEAVRLGAKKVQFSKETVSADLIEKAHAKGLICNLTYVEEVEEAEKYYRMGIDTILTRDYKKVCK